MKRTIWLVLAACGGGDSESTLEPPLFEVPGAVDRIAIGDSLFLARADSLLEFTPDGVEIGALTTVGEVLEVAAGGDTVAWVEVEGTGTVVKRRRGGGAVESQRTFDAHVVVSAAGEVFYSDLGLIASWGDGNPERIATPTDPAASPRLLAVDSMFAYAVDDATAITQYERGTDASVVTLETSTAATIRDGRMAYRTTEGVRVRDLATSTDGVAGFVPGSYDCELLLVETAVMCGKFRVRDGNAEELLADPVTGYAALGPDVYWVTTEGDASAVRVTDVETIASE